MPMEAFYASRYLKIAQAMRNIDRVAHHATKEFEKHKPFKGVGPRIMELAEAAKKEAETLRNDPVIFDVWSRFVAASEAVEAFQPAIPNNVGESGRHRIEHGKRLLQEGRNVITYVAGARVPMPRTTQVYVDKLDEYARHAK